MSYKSKDFQVVYQFDSTIPNWKARLTEAYSMLFAKIEKMEISKNQKEKKRHGDKKYGVQPTA